MHPLGIYSSPLENLGIRENFQNPARILSGGVKTLDLPLAITKYQGIPLEFIGIWGTPNNQ